MTLILFSALLLVNAYLFVDVQGHGRLVDPPSRNAMWKYGFPNKPNFNLNELNCGGAKNHWEVQGGKCGLCGDPYQGPRKHEAGYIGGYANGIIGRVYTEGQFIDVRVDITANHFGWFEFSLCPSNGAPVTQQCLNQYKLADSQGNTRHRLRLTGYKGTVHFQLRLPANLVCSQCVIQWFWFAGNSRDRIPQETFVNCADVVITRRDGTLDGGMVMPEILPQAYQPIPEANHTLGQGQVIGLEGEWDCSVPPPYNGPKERVYKEWCLENCLYALPDQRSCPVETCRCHRTDRTLSPDVERQLLGITDEYPEIGSSRQGSQSPSDSTRARGNLEGTWDCRVVHPFNHGDFYDWCIIHCIEALPHERDCPTTHCECWRTDGNFDSDEESRQLQPVPQTSRSSSQDSTSSTSVQDNVNWKRESQVPSQPNGLEGSWDCDVVSPYNTIAKRLHYYQWCLENCINAAPNDRFCPEDMCDCYRTDVRQSKEEIRAQLEGGVVQPPRTADSESRGIPPALESIIAYNEDIASDNGQLPALQGEWDCEVVFRIQHEEGAVEKRRELHEWCLDMCIRPQPNDRYCPQTHCRCYRTDVQQSDAENRRQLQTGVSVGGIIHAESGEEGSLANDQNRPYVGSNQNQQESPENQYTCEAVAPFHTGDQGRETLKFCYDSCVLEIASQRHCPESHCLCYETENPRNRLYSAESARPSGRSTLANSMRSNMRWQRQRRTRRSIFL